jgi:TonB-linked SusC/RagA family outer membrane protein
MKNEKRQSLFVGLSMAVLLTASPSFASAGNQPIINHNLSEATLPNQQSSVSGVVRDATGEPLVGVSVVVKGNSRQGAVTNIDGRYSINVPEGSTLIFSYVGYKSQQVKANGSSIDITLQEDRSNLEEVVVVGYGTMKKSDLTGTTSNVKTEALTTTVNGNALESLQGKAAGVQVFNNTKPGAAPNIRVRGSGSISASNEPLYVVDGFPLMDGDISDINPADIESMEILKDASSTAIYGSRGANGVVMITTKTGKTGTKNLNFSSSVGVQMPGRLMNLIKGQDFVNFINSAYTNAGLTSPFATTTPTVTNTDWEDLLLRDNAMLQNYSLSFDGASGGTSYMMSGGYYKQDGLVPTQSYEKFTFHSNLRHQFNKWLTVGANMQYTYATNNNQDNAVGNVPRYGWPTDSPYDENGNPTVPNNPYVTEAWNPLIDFPNTTDRTTTNRVIVNAFAEAKILKGLTYKLSIGQDVRNSRGYVYNTSLLPQAQSAGGKGSGGNSWYKNRSKVMENILTYTNQWDEHRLTATAVYSWQDFTYENLGLSGGGFVMDQTGAWNMNLADRSSWVASSTKYGNKLISYTGRVAYAYADKYLLTATARWDGSSRFGKNKKWGFFPSVGLAWRVSQEDFLKDNKVITDLKLRASFGITGNQEIGNYKSLSQLTSANYNDGTNQLSGFAETIGNTDLQWERTDQWNFGFDLGLFNRLTVNFDYYIRDTKDLLYDVPIPSTSGYTNILSNIGEVGNKGWELTIGGNIYKDKDWNIDASVNATYNKNKIKKLYGNVDKVVIKNGTTGINQELRVGQPVDGVYTRHSLGIIKTQEQLDWYKKYVPSTASDAKLGDEMYEDVDGNGSIGYNDYVCIGSVQPKYFYGLNLNASWKKFSISIYGQGGFKYASVVGAEDSSVNGSAWAMGYSNLGSYMILGENNVTNRLYFFSQYAYDRMWSVDNPNGSFPAAGSHGTWLSDRTNGDWNYFILKNIELGYDFTKLININTIKKVRFTLNFQNFVTFANHRGYNPINGDISNPWAKAVIFGIDLKF